MDLICYVDKNLLWNYPVTKHNILRAQDIFVANLGSVKGKLICSTKNMCNKQV